MKRCLVTGACGFVGSHMVDLLSRSGCDVLATDLPAVSRSRLNPEIPFMASDLANPASLKPVVEGREWIFHVASVFDYSASRELLASVNVHGTRALVEAGMQAGVERFILWSSVGVYGKPRPELLPIREDSPKAPSNPYERSKWDQEQVVWTACREAGLAATVLRPSPIVGPANVYGMATAIFLIAKGQLPVYVKNNANRTPSVHVADVVGSALHLASRPEAVGEAYNICDDSQMRMNVFAPLVASLLGVPLIGVRVPMPLFRFGCECLASWSLWEAKHITGKRPKVEMDTARYLFNDYAFSNDKLKSTGYVLKYPDVRVSIMETIDWYKERGWV